MWLRREALWIGLASLVLTLVYASFAWASTPAGVKHVSMSERIGNVIVIFNNLDVYIYFFQGVLLFVGIGFTIYYSIEFRRPAFISGLRKQTAELTAKLDLQQAIDHETENLLNKFLFLDLMIGGGPVAGLLGTVVGLVQVFHAQALVEHVTMQTITDGMKVAMVTTACGLLVGLLGIVGRHLLTSRVADLREILSGSK
jgi:hypothetical protein